MTARSASARTMDAPRIAVDVMGGDGGPVAVLGGVERALKADRSLRFLLVRLPLRLLPARALQTLYRWRTRAG